MVEKPKAGYAYSAKIVHEGKKGRKDTILVTSTEVETKIMTGKGPKTIRRPLLFLTYHGGDYGFKIRELWEGLEEKAKVKGGTKIFPVFEIKEGDKFVEDLIKRGKLTTSEWKGLPSVEIKVPGRVFRDLIKGSIGKFYANGINSFLSTHTYRNIKKGEKKEKEFVDRNIPYSEMSEFEVMKRHATPIMKETIGMLQIIRETGGKALVRWSKLNDEEREEIKRAFKKYTRHAKTHDSRKEYMVRTTTILKKRLSPKLSGMAAAENLARAINEEIKKNKELEAFVRKKGIKPFEHQELRELVRKASQLEKARKPQSKDIGLHNQVNALDAILKNMKFETMTVGGKTKKVKSISMREFERKLKNSKLR
ncbi:MAG: hypothetical protein J7L23_05435 [Candidatus Diapherotrites archaeon]|nr:hypothetical protein [Candidatus Diapherotrites archaeon]